MDAPAGGRPDAGVRGAHGAIDSRAPKTGARAALSAGQPKKPQSTRPMSVKSSALVVERSRVTALVDPDNPWPGLSSFTEETRALFFGRDKETDELSRLVSRETLTVLFGQSGLGKSSLLQAGLFPLLRESDHLPLYLRLDHSSVIGTPSPALADQVKAALNAEFAAAKVDAPALGSDE